MAKVSKEDVKEIVRLVKAKVPPKEIAHALGITDRQVYYHLEKAGVTSKEFIVRRAFQSNTRRFCLSLDKRNYDKLKNLQDLYGLTSLNKTVERLMSMTQVQAAIDNKQRQLDKENRHCGHYGVGTETVMSLRKRRDRPLQELLTDNQSQINRIKESW